MESAPRAGANADAVWTGSEAIFLDADGTESLEGQTYNPSNGAWKRIATAPIAARSGAIALWTGSEVIVWGGGPDERTALAGAAYDPDRDQWRRIARGPVALNHLDGMWSGSEMLVFGSLLDSRNIAETRTSVGAAYDPEADEWREMQPSELSPQATSAVWMGDRMVAWDYLVRSQEYDPEIDSWSDPVRMPLEFGECYPDSVVARRRVFAFYCGYAALYDASSSTWQEIHGGPLEEVVGSGAYKLWRFAQLVSTGDTVLLQAEGITESKNGEVCYGCPGSPVSFWAYRPSG